MQHTVSYVLLFTKHVHIYIYIYQLMYNVYYWLRIYLSLTVPYRVVETSNKQTEIMQIQRTHYILLITCVRCVRCFIVLLIS